MSVSLFFNKTQENYKCECLGFLTECSCSVCRENMTTKSCGYDDIICSNYCKKNNVERNEICEDSIIRVGNFLKDNKNNSKQCQYSNGLICKLNRDVSLYDDANIHDFVNIFLNNDRFKINENLMMGNKNIYPQVNVDTIHNLFNQQQSLIKNLLCREYQNNNIAENYLNYINRRTNELVNTEHDVVENDIKNMNDFLKKNGDNIDKIAYMKYILFDVFKHPDEHFKQILDAILIYMNYLRYPNKYKNKNVLNTVFLMIFTAYANISKVSANNVTSTQTSPPSPNKTSTSTAPLASTAASRSGSNTTTATTKSGGPSASTSAPKGGNGTSNATTGIGQVSHANGTHLAVNGTSPAVNGTGAVANNTGSTAQAAPGQNTTTLASTTPTSKGGKPGSNDTSSSQTPSKPTATLGTQNGTSEDKNITKASSTVTSPVSNTSVILSASSNHSSNASIIEGANTTITGKGELSENRTLEELKSNFTADSQNSSLYLLQNGTNGNVSGIKSYLYGGYMVDMSRGFSFGVNGAGSTYNVPRGTALVVIPAALILSILLFLFPKRHRKEKHE